MKPVGRGESSVFDDIQKSIKAQLYERVSSPLLASFGISWLAWNYRFVMVIVSSLPLHEKLSFIDTEIFATYQQVLLYGLLYPLITALFMIFVYPIPAKYVYEHWRRRQSELKFIQHRIDNETPLSREEARELRREALKMSLEYDKEIQGKIVEIARLREHIDGMQQRGSPISTANSPALSEKLGELDEAQIGMLENVAQSEDGVLKKQLLLHSGDDMVHAEYNLGELNRRELVTENFSGSKRDYVVKATHLGRTLLVLRGKPK